MVLQCVMVLPYDSSHIPKHSSGGLAPAFLNTIFGKRSSSVPLRSVKQDHRSRFSSSTDSKPKSQHCIRFWIGVNCDEESQGPTKRSKDPLLSPGGSWVPPFFADLAAPPHRPPAPARAVSYSAAKVELRPAHAVTDGPIHEGTGVTSVRKRSASQHTFRLGVNIIEQQPREFISLEVSDGRCLAILLDILQSSQTQGLLSPQSIIGELDIDDRDEAIQEAMQMRKRGLASSASPLDQDVDAADLDDSNAKGLHLRLSRSHNASHMPIPNDADSDDDGGSPLIRTPVLKEEFDAVDDGRTSRSKETRHFEHLVKSRAEFPDIQITPVNAYHYGRAHSASPARFARALPSMI